MFTVQHMMGHIWRKEMSIAKTQTSESFRLSALLSFSGGLQDAYTYNVRDGVFANAQTGNVVLMSQNFMQGEWDKGLHYMLPLISFAAGIFLAERVESRCRPSERFMGTDTPVRCVSEI